MTGAFSYRLPDPLQSELVEAAEGGEAARTGQGARYKRATVDLSQWPPRFTKVQVTLSDGTALCFTDPRRLGRVLLSPDPESELSKALGPDCLNAMMPLPEFASALAVRSAPIKAVLLDQSFVAGIGNWIADEVLYQARIHPESRCNALSPDDVAGLHTQIQTVVRTACDVEADHTLFPKEWLFHVRWNKEKTKSRDSASEAKVAGKGRKGQAAAASNDRVSLLDAVDPPVIEHPKRTDTDHAGHRITFLTVGGRTSAVVTAVQGAPKHAPYQERATGKKTKVRKASEAAATSSALPVDTTARPSVRSKYFGANEKESEHSTPASRLSKRSRGVNAELPAQEAGKKRRTM
jgi:formamidopyrimidine-DNA glycosylase